MCAGCTSRGDELERHVHASAACHRDLLSHWSVARRQHRDDVRARRHAQRRGERRLARIEPVDLDARAVRAGHDRDLADQRGLAGALIAGPSHATRIEPGRIGEQLVERVDGLHGASRGRKHEPHVVEHHRVRHELVRALELRERAFVVLLIEEAQTAIEAPSQSFRADGVRNLSGGARGAG